MTGASQISINPCLNHLGRNLSAGLSTSFCLDRLQCLLFVGLPRPCHLDNPLSIQSPTLKDGNALS